MSAERNSELQICPYWRRYVKYGDAVLALCGAESIAEQPLEIGEESRRQSCPWFEAGEAFKSPAIIELPFSWREANGEEIKIWQPTVIKAIDIQGKKGIDMLEQIWNQEEEKFIQRHSQPQ